MIRLKKIVFAAVVLAGCCLVSGPSLAVDKGLPSDEQGGRAQAGKKAQTQAWAWLKLVDNGQYDESWNQAAPFFKNAVSRESWLKSMRAFRMPLGEKLSREISTSRYFTALPGAPDGRYVIIRFKSSFTHKARAVETLTLMMDAKGRWRVSGYYIK